LNTLHVSETLQLIHYLANDDHFDHRSHSTKPCNHMMTMVTLPLKVKVWTLFYVVTLVTRSTFTISEVAADQHELMVLQGHIIACTNELSDL